MSFTAIPSLHQLGKHFAVLRTTPVILGLLLHSSGQLEAADRLVSGQMQELE
jgi:hypothetical protein